MNEKIKKKRGPACKKVYTVAINGRPWAQFSHREQLHYAYPTKRVAMAVRNSWAHQYPEYKFEIVVAALNWGKL